MHYRLFDDQNGWTKQAEEAIVDIPRSKVRKAAASAMRNAGIAIDWHRVDRLDDALPCRRTPYLFEGRLEKIPQAYGRITSYNVCYTKLLRRDP